MVDSELMSTFRFRFHPQFNWAVLDRWDSCASSGTWTRTRPTRRRSTSSRPSAPPSAPCSVSAVSTRPEGSTTTHSRFLPRTAPLLDSMATTWPFLDSCWCRLGAATRTSTLRCRRDADDASSSDRPAGTSAGSRTCK